MYIDGIDAWYKSIQGDAAYACNELWWVESSQSSLDLVWAQILRAACMKNSSSYHDLEAYQHLLMKTRVHDSLNTICSSQGLTQNRISAAALVAEVLHQQISVYVTLSWLFTRPFETTEGLLAWLRESPESVTPTGHLVECSVKELELTKRQMRQQDGCRPCPE